MTIESLEETVENEQGPFKPQYQSVEPKHCHKALRHNAFITGTRRIGENKFQMIAHVDHVREQHFFDHEIDHIPGMLTACIIRQSVLVACHVHMQVPFSKKFLMDHLEVSFHDHAHLNEEIHVDCEFRNLQTKSSLPRKGVLIAVVRQGINRIATGSLAFRVYDPAAFHRLNQILKLNVDKKD
jgi:hypothetical protein